MSERVVACGAEYPCWEDQEEPCFCPFIGPAQRRYETRYSARFVGQMRSLSGDHRWPLRVATEAPR